MKFIKFMSNSFLNGQNIALYQSKRRYLLMAEIDEKVKGMLEFKTEAEADEWYDSIPGSGVGQLDNALGLMVD